MKACFPRFYTYTSLSFQDPKPLPYLQHDDKYNYDINLEVKLKGNLAFSIPPDTVPTETGKIKMAMEESWGVNNLGKVTEFCPTS